VKLREIWTADRMGKKAEVKTGHGSVGGGGKMPEPLDHEDKQTKLGKKKGRKSIKGKTNQYNVS